MLEEIACVHNAAAKNPTTRNVQHVDVEKSVLVSTHPTTAY